MRTILLIVGLLAVAACEGQQPPQPQYPSLGQIEDACGYDSRPFAEAWPCVRQRFAGTPTDQNLLALYLARGDFVAEQARAGKMSDTEARLVMAEAANRSKNEVRQQEDAQRNAEYQRRALAIGALSVVQQSRPVTCNRVGSTVTCY